MNKVMKRIEAVSAAGAAFVDALGEPLAEEIEIVIRLVAERAFELAMESAEGGDGV